MEFIYEFFHIKLHIITWYFKYNVGREQVSVGVVPIDLAAAGKGTKGCQSALAVYPIAIANCAKKRYVEINSLYKKW